MSETFDAATARVVALVGGSHFVHHSYFMLLPPIFLPLRTDVGLTDPQIGLALGTLGLVVTALQLPFGHLSDSHSRTLVLAISFVFGAAGAALTAIAWDFTSLVAAQVILGIGIAGHHPAHYPLISAATTDATRGRAYSVHGFSGALGFATPPAVIAAAATLGVGWRLAIGGIAAVGALYGGLCLLVFHRSVDRRITHPPAADRPADGELAPRADRFVAGLRSLFSSRPILALTVLWFVSSMAAWSVKQYTGTLLTDGYGVGPAAANLAVSAMLVVGAILIFAGGWLTDRYSPGPVLLVGYGGFVLFTGVLALSTIPVIAAIAVVLVLSATVDAGRPARAALADRFSTSDSVGKNFGLLTIGISGGAAVAPPILSSIISRAGIAWAFAAIAAFGVLAGGLTLVVLSLDGSTTRPMETPAD